MGCRPAQRVRRVDRRSAAGDRPGCAAHAECFTMLMRHPALAGPVPGLQQAPAPDSRESSRACESSWSCGSRSEPVPYEWLPARAPGAAMGGSPRRRSMPSPTAPSPPVVPVEADLLMATDELFDDHRIDDETWPPRATRRRAAPDRGAIHRRPEHVPGDRVQQLRARARPRARHVAAPRSPALDGWSRPADATVRGRPPVQRS